MRAFPLIVAAALCALAFVPIAVASHNMGHRYLVYGRLLDAGGNPVQNQDVEVRLMLAGALISSILTKTDCLGDFDSWKGRRGAAQGPVKPGDDGYGEIEEIPAARGLPAYVNFHFHDPHLSSAHRFEMRVAGETFTVGFSPKTRQTQVLHTLQGTVATACGGYADFQNTFEIRTYIARADEMTFTQEPELRPRTVNISYGDPVRANATVTTDFMYTAIATFNVTPLAGDVVRLASAEIGTKTLHVSQDQLKYRRLDSVNVVGGDSGVADLSDFRLVGFLFLAAALIVGGYFAGTRMKSKYEERRLRETSTRRRFRRDRPPESP